jgi:hypothetical protein
MKKRRKIRGGGWGLSGNHLLLQMRIYHRVLNSQVISVATSNYSKKRLEN